MSDRCGDCNVARGGYHHLGCDMQRCPVCRGQLLSCGCHFDEDEPFSEDDLFDDECDCDGCRDDRDDECGCDWSSEASDGGVGRSLSSEFSAVASRVVFNALMRGIVGAGSDEEFDEVMARMVQQADPVGVDADGTVVLSTHVGGTELILRTGEYPDCDVLELDGFAATTPLRSLIDRATEISPVALGRDLDRFMSLGLVTPADAWRRVSQPDMANHPGAAVLRRLLPPTPATG